MDHFILPYGAEPYITVPYRCTALYDGGDFFTFPARNNWTDDEVHGANDFGGRSSAEIESFFQTWLFFGTLTEISKLVGLPVAIEDFITTSDDAEPVVTTRKLPALLQQWSKILNHSSKCDCCFGLDFRPSRKKCGKTALKTATKIIEVVRQLVYRFCLSSRMVLAQQAWPVAPEISLSISALAFTLQAALRSIYHVYINSVILGGTAVLEQRLLDAKWCPLYIFMAKGLGIDGIYYVAANPKTAEQDHSRCQGFVCVAKGIDEEKYVTKHVTDDCDCGFESSPEDELLDVIKRGGTPLLRWMEREDGKGYRLAVSEHWPEPILAESNDEGQPSTQSSQPQYIAISHV
jgi:hypothetical protein